MEHSLLHGLQLCGLIFALGGVLFRWLVLAPISREGRAAQTIDLDRLAALWITRAAFAATVGALIDFVVQVAEIEGKTIYAGVSAADVLRYLLGTTVGRIAAVKTSLLVLVTVLARHRSSNAILLILLTGSAFCATLISHSAALPTHRSSAIVAQFIHIVGAAFWLGMLANVLVATLHLRTGVDADQELLGRAIARFSPYALASVILIFVSGIYSSIRFIVSPRAVIVSAYGLTLLLKLLLLALVSYAGFLNWRLIRPQLLTRRKEARSALLAKFFRLLEFEFSAGVVLILVAGILGAVSPPSEPGSAQLSSSQTEAVLSPRLPRSHFVDPNRFLGSATRTDDDLRYAEFTHQWSGVFVAVLGLLWLGQTNSRKHENVFARSWPVLLIPFGVFISWVADPEVWIVHSSSIGEILATPQVFEHQTGALMVFVLAALGLREIQRPRELRPLGYALPILIIAGSLMLLGHAHSNLGVSEELTSLINMEHAVIGGFGLIAGVARWFQLRRLPGENIFRFLWPISIILLGLFMAFFYRELTPAVSLAFR